MWTGVSRPSCTPAGSSSNPAATQESTMKITNVRAILTAPDGIALIVVKVETDQPGLYGLGCATFTQRPTLVARAVDEYLDPLLQGRDPRNIEDLWHMMLVNSYWRNGPVLNNAVSGVDMALWDINAKRAGMPLYQLLGGKCREGAACYRHADGASHTQVEESVRRWQAEGYQYIRVQMGGYGGRTAMPKSPEGSPPGAYFHAKGYARS